MRRVVFGLVAVGMLSTQQAQAQLQCLTPDQRAAVQVAALRSELMVLATGCHEDDHYNAFIRKYQADLIGNEKAIGDLLKHKYGKRAQQEHDRFTTEMANDESSAGMLLGGDFCAHNGMIFTEVLALNSANDLAAYAAGKDLVPSTLEMCAEEAKAPVRKVATPAAKHH